MLLIDMKTKQNSAPSGSQHRTIPRIPSMSPRRGCDLIRGCSHWCIACVVLTKSTAGFGSSCSHKSSPSVRRIFTVVYVMQQGKGSRRNPFWGPPWPPWCIAWQWEGCSLLVQLGRVKMWFYVICLGMTALQGFSCARCGCCQGGKAGVPKDVPKGIPRDGHCVAGSTSRGWQVLGGRGKFNIAYF